jgi:hypothetical protein
MSLAFGRVRPLRYPFLRDPLSPSPSPRPRVCLIVLLVDARTSTVCHLYRWSYRARCMEYEALSSSVRLLFPPLSPSLFVLCECVRTCHVSCRSSLCCLRVSSLHRQSRRTPCGAVRCGAVPCAPLRWAACTYARNGAATPGGRTCAGLCCGSAASSDIPSAAQSLRATDWTLPQSLAPASALLVLRGARTFNLRCCAGARRPLLHGRQRTQFNNIAFGMAAQQCARLHRL